MNFSSRLMLVVLLIFISLLRAELAQAQGNDTTATPSATLAPSKAPTVRPTPRPTPPTARPTPATAPPTTQRPTTRSPTIADACPNDPNKLEPGQCGCSVPDTDSDGDGYADCIDQCPDDFKKSNKGLCGCGVSDTLVDNDRDGIPECSTGKQPILLSPGSRVRPSWTMMAVPAAALVAANA